MLPHMLRLLTSPFRSVALLGRGGVVCGILLISYFTYHAFAGERNVFALFRLAHKIDVQTEQLQKLTAEHEAAENKIKLLYVKSLDNDMLDESARRQLGYIGKNEAMIFIDKR